MPAGSIIIDLLMKTGSFETDTKRAEARLRSFEKEATRIGSAIGVGLGVAFTATAALVKSSIDEADAASKAAQSVGLTTEAYTGMTYAAELAGVGNEEFTTGLARLSRSAVDADEGIRSSADAFDYLGVKVRGADGALKGNEQLLKELADAFSKLPEGPQKTAAAMDIFGRAGAKLLPLLNSGAAGMEALRVEAEGLGIVIDTKTAKAAEEFNDTLTKAGKVVTGFGLALARDALPTLQVVASSLLDSATNGGILDTVISALGATFKTVFQTIAVVGANVAFTLTGVGREIGAIAAQVAALGRGDIDGFRAISRAVKEDAARARAELDEFERRVMSSGNTIAAQLGNPANAVTLDRPASSRPRQRQPAKPVASRDEGAARYLEGLQKQIEGLRDQTAAEKALTEIQEKRLGGITPALERQIIATATLLDKQREAIAAEESAQKAREGAAALSNRQVSALSDETDALRLANTATQEEIQILAGGEEARRAIEKARIDSAIALKEDTLAQLENTEGQSASTVLIRQQIELLKTRSSLLSQRDSIERLREEKVEVEDLNDLAKELGLTFTSAFEDAIVEGKGLRDVLNGLAGDILRITTRKLITEPLGSSISGAIGGSGGVGGLLSSLGAALFGGGQGIGLTSSGTSLASYGLGGGRAIGGDVLPKTRYTVGESGPELFVPRAMGVEVQAAITQAKESARFIGGRAIGGDVLEKSAYIVGENGPELFVPRSVGTIVPAALTEAITKAMGPVPFKSDLDAQPVQIVAPGLQGMPAALTDAIGKAVESAPFSGGRAIGGAVFSDRAYMVGEAGPEMFVPRTAGAILPAVQTAAMAGGGARNFAQTLNITVEGRVDGRTAKQIAADAGRQAQRALRSYA